jgi:glutathione S-transferase
MQTDTHANRFVLHGDGFWISPYVYTCFVALTEKGLPFEVREVHLERDENHQPGYEAASLTGRVPALQHGAFWLAESSAIVDYLEDIHPSPALLPTDVRDRSRARMILAWVRSDLMPIREERPTHTMFYVRADRPLSPAGDEAVARLLRVAERMVPDGGGPLFGSFSIADADLAFMLHRLLLNGEPVPAKLRRYAEAIWARPSVRAFVERERPPYVPYG